MITLMFNICFFWADVTAIRFHKLMMKTIEWKTKKDEGSRRNGRRRWIRAK